MKKQKIFLASLFSAILFLPILAMASFNYTPMEQIPGFATSGEFCSYISAVYKFGIWAVGISAMLMIIIGGYMYMMSAGNTASTGKAKGVITDAIVGLILALTSYLLLYTINPNLLTCKIIGAGTVSSGGGAATTPGQPTTGGGGGGKTCTDGKCANVAAACQANKLGVEPAKLQSLLIAGEGCNKSQPKTSSACGYSQVLAKYRKTVCGLTGSDDDTCKAVQNDIDKDIACGAKMVIESSNKGSDMASIAKRYGDGTQAYLDKVVNYYNTCK